MDIVPVPAPYLLPLFDHFVPKFTRYGGGPLDQEFIYLEDRTELNSLLGLTVTLSDLGVDLEQTSQSPTLESGWLAVLPEEWPRLHALLLGSLSDEQCLSLLNNLQYVNPYVIRLHQDLLIT
jgi:hypothetical protein